MPNYATNPKRYAHSNTITRINALRLGWRWIAHGFVVVGRSWLGLMGTAEARVANGRCKAGLMLGRGRAGLVLMFGLGLSLQAEAPRGDGALSSYVGVGLAVRLGSY